ncbi:MAG TPA: hypothetical protein ENN72_00355 [Firmicutes bacterium]|nr:hypothetical protein [Bacillota bacterium]
MKYLKIVFIVAIAGCALFYSEKRIKPLLINQWKNQARQEVNQALVRQYEAIFNGLVAKENAVDSLAQSLSARTDADEISGILEGNLSQFLWLEYIDASGVPVNKAGERTDDFVLSRSLPRGARIETGIDLKSFVETRYQPRTAIVRNPEPIIRELSQNPDMVYGTLPLDETGYSIVLSQLARPLLYPLWIIQGGLLLLGLLAVGLIIRNTRRIDIPSLTSFFEQIQKGNSDLRFEIKGNDPLKNVKEGINFFLDSTQKDYAEASVEKKKILSFCQTLHTITREQTPSKQYQFFLSFLVNELLMESFHLFVKDSQQVLYFRGLDLSTIPSTPNLEKLFSMEEKSLLDEFDLSSVINEEDTSIHAYIVYPLHENAILLLPKSQLSHIKLDTFDIFVKLFKQVLVLHHDRIDAIRNKVYTEKGFNRSPVGFIWATQDGRIKKVNDAARSLLLVEEEGLNMLDFLIQSGINTDPIETAAREGKSHSFQASINDRSFIFSATALLLSDQGQYDLLFSLTDVSGLNNEKAMALHEAESTIKRYETEINRLTKENYILQEKTEETADSTAAEFITAPMAASLSRTGKLIKTLLPLVFDDNEKRMLLHMRKELTSLNFLVRDILLYRKETAPDIEEGEIIDYIKKSFDLVKQDLREKRCSVQADLKHAPTLQFDKTLMSLAFFNLFLFVAQAAGDKARLTVQSADKNGQFFLLTTLSEYQATAVRGTMEHQTDRFSVFFDITAQIAKAHGGALDIRETNSGLAITLMMP